jgi:hypothetical protein
MMTSEDFRLRQLADLRATYPSLPEADILEVYRRVTHIRWFPTWDDDELALRSYYRNDGVPCGFNIDEIDPRS